MLQPYNPKPKNCVKELGLGVVMQRVELSKKGSP